ncbi:MAG: tetratricopeptide repeat protein [Gammaproteobacteria bacterium]|nr:tetratricopeptide repeat protein [Gammaproteobacteria bacterium]
MGQYKANQEMATEKNHECYVLGCKAYDANEYHKAITLFKESLEYWPEDPQAWMALGNCYGEIKRYKNAENSYRQALIYLDDQKKKTYYLIWGIVCSTKADIPKQLGVINS